jgi:hypothetical protein
MDGDFTAEIRVYENGSVQGRVIDNAADEEYIPLRMPNYTGAFVGSVREAYRELLCGIADSCCTDVAFTVLDVLGYLDEIPVCTAYEIDGKETTEFPVTHELAKAKPVYTMLPGWKCDIRGIRKYEDLPENCRNYIEFIEERIGFPITMVSNGPGRDDIIYRKSRLHA